VALLRSQSKAEAAKEVLQLAEYFLVAYAVFVNVAETGDLKPFLIAFAASTGVVVLWGLVGYFTAESALDVRASFKDRNALGAFLACALPPLYGIALYARTWPVRIALLALVALGLLVNLSGGAVLVTLLVLGVLSAVRSHRALAAYAAALALILVVAPWLLPRPHHTDVLFSSIAPYVDDNFLLSDKQLVETARELLNPTQVVELDKRGTRGLPPPSPLDAARLLDLLSKRRPLTRDEIVLRVEIEDAIKAIAPEKADAYPLRGPQVAFRYRSWDAAITCARSLWWARKDQVEKHKGDPFFGYGFSDYQEVLVGRFMPGERAQYRTNQREVFNVAAAEPFTFNQWLKSLVQTGLVGFLALAALVATFLGRAARLYATAHSELMLGVALGGLGAVLGFALVGIFTENVTRGLAIPFVFVCAAIAIGERIVYGESKAALEQLNGYDTGNP
jgi:hypothetical protein